MINEHGIISNEYELLVETYAQCNVLRVSFTKQVRM
jgi:hypothetical protein